MSAAHTPGPWVVQGRSFPTQPIVVGKAELGPLYTLAKIYQPPGRRYAAANAKLIAAAPELLEALQLALKMLPKRYSTSQRLSYAKIDAAIAKATT